MDGATEPPRDVAMVTLLVAALTGQHELTESERQAIGEWMVDHAENQGVRDLITKMVRTQIADTSEFRAKVAEAIRERFQSAGTGETTDERAVHQDQAPGRRSAIWNRHRP
jgi:hypothetical protein